MEKSNTIDKITKALIAFHKEVLAIGKDSDNPFFKSKYASLAKILRTIDEPLHNNGLTVVQLPSGGDGLTTMIMHESGEWISDTMSMRPVKNDPQGIGSCITYMRRYAIGAVLCLNIDKDDDANSASYVADEDFRLEVADAKAAMESCDTPTQFKGLWDSLTDEVRAELADFAKVQCDRIRKNNV